MLSIALTFINITEKYFYVVNFEFAEKGNLRLCQVVSSVSIVKCEMERLEETSVVLTD